MFKAKQGPQKLATDLTVNAVMNSTSKYLSQGPLPVGEYQHDRKIQPNERYGANRRANKFERKNQATTTNSSNNSNLQNTNTASQKTNQNIARTEQQLKAQVINRALNMKNKVIKIQTVQQTPPRPIKVPITQAASQNKKVASSKSNIQIQNKNSNSTNNLSNNLNTIDPFANTPTPTTSRYGANRRIQAKKTQQIIQKYQPTISQQIQIKPQKQVTSNYYQSQKQKSVSEISTPKSSRVQPITSRYGNKNKQQEVVSPFVKEINKPQQLQNSQISYQSRNSRTISQVSSPKSVTDRQNFQSKTPIVSKIQNNPTQNLGQPQKIDQKQFSRSTTRTQLKTKQQPTPISVKQTQKQVKIQQKESNNSQVTKNKRKSNILLFMMKKLYQDKLQYSVIRLKQNTKSSKHKQINLTKIFLQKLHKCVQKMNSQMNLVGFKKINKFIASPAIVKPDIKIIQHLQINKNKLLPTILHTIFKKQLRNSFKKLAFKKKSANYDKFINVLSRLQKRKFISVFMQIKLFASRNHTNKTRIFNNLTSISKSFKKNILLNVFRKILCSKNSDKTSTKTPKKLQKQSPISQLEKGAITPEVSPQKIQKIKNQLRKQQKLYENNNKILKNLKQANIQQKNQYIKKIQDLKAANQDLSQQNQFKKQLTQQLKQRADQIKFPEQDYIEPTDMLNENKFSVLYQIFIKLEKQSENIKINNLLSYFPALQDQIHKNKLVNDWVQIQHNLWLKQQLSRYEGQPEYEKKASKMANEQRKILTQMIRGYIKQKYTWQWVKNALTHVTHN